MSIERRHFSPQEKVSVLKRHLLENTPVSELCDQAGIKPTVFYRWQKELFENGHATFANGRRPKALDAASDRRIAELEAKLARKNEVLGELLDQHMRLQQELAQPRNREENP